MRQIVLDTETTGLSPTKGDRVIEIGCIELINRKVTKNHFHEYLNPECTVGEGAFRVHGLSNEFLSDKPKFSEVMSEFLSYINGAEIIIHNAPFDVGFLNMELKRAKAKPDTLEQYATIFDTLVEARNKHPGQKNSLDALCVRYDVKNTDRALHGALKDSELLGQVYLAMTGGQSSLFDKEKKERKEKMTQKKRDLAEDLNVIKASDEEARAHQFFLDMLNDKSGQKAKWLAMHYDN